MAIETTSFPRDTTMQRVRNALHMISITQSGRMSNVESWRSIQQLVRNGYAPKVLPVGTELAATHTTYGDYIWQVTGHDQYKKPGDSNAHTMTLYAKRVIYARPFDATEAMYYVDASVWPAGIPAGTYNFTLPAGYEVANGGGATLEFTTTQVVPVGGVIIFPWAGGTQASATKISTYATRQATTAIESNLTVTVGDSGTPLGTANGNTAHMNHIHRMRYGSNHYGESDIRQWINSELAANIWWSPRTEFDRPSQYASSPGFLAEFDTDFLGVLGEVDVITAYNAVFNIDGETSGSYTLRDKMFLASYTEVGHGENGIAEGEIFSLYSGAGNTDRIKYDITNAATARYYWLRSPDPSNAFNSRRVDTSGALNYTNAGIGYGCVPACVIY